MRNLIVSFILSWSPVRTTKIICWVLLCSHASLPLGLWSEYSVLVVIQTLVSVYLCFLAITTPPMSPEIPTATPSRPITTPTIIPVELDEPVLSDSTLQVTVGKTKETVKILCLEHLSLHQPLTIPAELDEPMLSDSTVQVTVRKTKAPVKILFLEHFTWVCHCCDGVRVRSNISIVIHSSYFNGIYGKRRQSSQ